VWGVWGERGKNFFTILPHLPHLPHLPPLLLAPCPMPNAPAPCYNSSLGCSSISGTKAWLVLRSSGDCSRITSSIFGGCLILSSTSGLNCDVSLSGFIFSAWLGTVSLFMVFTRTHRPSLDFLVARHTLPWDLNCYLYQFAINRMF